MSVITADNAEHFPSRAREVFDVSGAGDTVIAVATLCLLAEAPLAAIAQISNIAGGMVCEKPGVVSISIEELKKQISCDIENAKSFFK